MEHFYRLYFTKSYSTPPSDVPNKHTPCFVVIILQLSTYQLRIRRHQLCCNRNGRTGKYVVATSKFLGLRHTVSGRGLSHEQYGVCITTLLLGKEFYRPQCSPAFVDEPSIACYAITIVYALLTRTTSQDRLLKNTEHLKIRCNV
jgi:hypothetical protein